MRKQVILPSISPNEQITEGLLLVNLKNQSMLRLVSLLSVAVLASSSSLNARDRDNDHTIGMQGFVEVGGRQVVLPEGEWVVAGRDRNTVVTGVSGAFGTIENLILFNLEANQVRALVEINTNSISVTEGWGTTEACSREDILANFNLYRTAFDGLCFFVAKMGTVDTDDEGPKAWAKAKSFAKKNDLEIPTHWLTIGYRVSDRHDVVDVRYHFDGRDLGDLAPSRTVWTKNEVEAKPEKFIVVNSMNAWAGLMAELFQLGLHGKLETKLNGMSVPRPELLSGIAELDRDSIGVSSKTNRKLALEKLVDEGVIAPKDFEAYLAEIENVPPPPTEEDYYKTLIKKTISYSFLRVGVDYILAFIVTTNYAVSGYITGAIVATHSVAQVINDKIWDDYISGQQRDGSELVEFSYVGRLVEKKE